MTADAATGILLIFDFWQKIGRVSQTVRMGGFDAKVPSASAFVPFAGTLGVIFGLWHFGVKTLEAREIKASSAVEGTWHGISKREGSKPLSCPFSQNQPP